MDKLQLQEDVGSLQKLRVHYEGLLSHIGIDMCELPHELADLLDECADLQRSTNLHSLDEHYLKEFYYTRKREQLDANLIIGRLQAEIKEQQRQLAVEALQCAALEKFTTAVNKRLISEAELLHNAVLLDTKMRSLERQQSVLQLPEDLNVDDLIKNIELLKAQQRDANKFWSN